MVKTYNKSGSLLYSIDESKEIARGGEGRILEISSTRVAKLYLPGIKPIPEKKYHELSELTSNTFIKPEELLFDDRGVVIGFTMNKVPSNFFPILSLFNKNFCLREGITDDVKKKTFDRIIDAIKFAHSKNIVIGDLNQYNLLVDDSGMVYFIDVDSYETPSFRHSNILLDDIRDFLYNGTVSLKSDYFALAILYFNAFTFVHPFKGICKAMPKISERMIHKKSVLTTLNDVIIPKCYEPLTNTMLLEQFNKIFNLGERFVLNASLIAPTVTAAPKKVDNTNVIIKTDDLVIHPLYNISKILASYSSRERLVLITGDKKLLVYDVSLKGSFNQVLVRDNFNHKENKIFVYKNQIFSLTSNTLVDLISGKVLHTFNANYFKSEIYNNIIVVVTNDKMFKFDLDKVFNGAIQYEVSDVFGGKFNGFGSLFQNVSGNAVVFYEKNALNSTVLKQNVKALHQRGQFGIFETVENETVKIKMFSIKNLKIEVFDTNFNELRCFDMLNDSTLVIPNDDSLSLYRVDDMKEILSFQCNLVSNDSIIHCTNGGIIVVNNDSVYLMNKK